MLVIWSSQTPVVAGLKKRTHIRTLGLDKPKYPHVKYWPLQLVRCYKMIQYHDHEEQL